MTVAADYGSSAVDLETLRRLVEIRCARVRFEGFTSMGAQAGEYSFALAGQRNRARVQAPLTPAGRPRGGIGLWRFCLARGGPSCDAWESTGSVDEVVDWLCAKAGC